MANIDLTNGEQYTFGKLSATPVILGGTDHAHSLVTFRNKMSIDATNISSATTCILAKVSQNSNTTPILQLQNTSTNSAADSFIQFTTTSGSSATAMRNIRMGIDADQRVFKITDQAGLIAGSYLFQIDTDGDAFVKTDLHVGDDLSVTDNCTITGHITLNGSAQNAMVIGENNGHDSRIVIYEADATRRNRLHIGADATCAFVEGTFGSGGSMDLQIRNNGSVCADFEPSEMYFHTIDSSAGNADMRYNTTSDEMTYSTSTRNIKKNIVEISGSDDILNVKSVSYDYKDGSGAEIGFIAEDVAAVNPIFARYGPDFKYDDNGKKVHKIGKWEDDGSGKMIPKEGAFPKGTTQKDRYEKNSDNLVPIDINVRALLSHAVQKIQDLEARIKALETA